jgi:hypothetical protein
MARLGLAGFWQTSEYHDQRPSSAHRTTLMFLGDMVSAITGRASCDGANGLWWRLTAE